MCLFEPLLDIEKEMEVVMAGLGESFMPGTFRAYQQAEEMAIESGILRVGNTGSHNCPESSKLNWFWLLYSLTLARSPEVLFPLRPGITLCRRGGNSGSCDARSTGEAGQAPEEVPEGQTLQLGLAFRPGLQ